MYIYIYTFIYNACLCIMVQRSTFLYLSVLGAQPLSASHWLGRPYTLKQTYRLNEFIRGSFRSCPALPCPALPCPALPGRALPCPALPCPVPARPVPCALCPALPPALPCARTHNWTPIHLSSAWLCNVVVHVSNSERKQRARKNPLRGVYSKP